MTTAPDLDAPQLPEDVRLFIADVLAWDRSVAKLERAVFGGASNFQLVVNQLQLGVLGTGCRGTKGTGRARYEVDDLEAAAQADPVGTARYQRLRGADLAATNVVLEDQVGDVLREVVVGKRAVEASLPARVGLALAGRKQRIAWLKKIAEGDSKPALEGAEEDGIKHLAAAAKAWWKPAA